LTILEFAVSIEPNIFLMPRIATWVLPESEQDAASAVFSNLNHMSVMVERFQSAIELYDYSIRKRSKMPDGEDQNIVAKWPFMAGQIAAMTIYDFFQLTQAINKQLHLCPTILNVVDQEAKKCAQREFSVYFPDYANLRNAAAHIGELSSTTAKLKLNSAAVSELESINVGGNSEAKIRIGQLIHNDRYASTFEGKLVELSLNEESIERLAGCLIEWRKAFMPAEIETKRLLELLHPELTENR
jgi:hypothetical protein